MGLVRDLASAAGAVLIVATIWSVIGTVVVPRRVRSRIPRAVGITVNATFHFIADSFDTYERRDRVLAAQAPVQLMMQIVAWLAVFELGFALLLCPSWHQRSGARIALAGSSLCTLGYLAPHNTAPTVLVDLASLVGLSTVALQIGYLPTLYSAFTGARLCHDAGLARRPALVGSGAAGPHALRAGLGISAVTELPALFEDWERWSADVSESHATYLPLLTFRSHARCPRG